MYAKVQEKTKILEKLTEIQRQIEQLKQLIFSVENKNSSASYFTYQKEKDEYFMMIKENPAYFGYAKPKDNDEDLYSLDDVKSVE